MEALKNRSTEQNNVMVLFYSRDTNMWTMYDTLQQQTILTSVHNDKLKSFLNHFHETGYTSTIVESDTGYEKMILLHRDESVKITSYKRGPLLVSKF